MFPHDRSSMPLESYLHRLLCALVIEHGGELRIKARSMMQIEPGQALTRTRDRKRDEIVLRFGDVNTETYFVPQNPSESPNKNPEEPQWQPQTGRIPATQPQLQEWLNRAADANPQPHSRHVIMDDMTQFLNEQRRDQAVRAKLEAEMRAQQFREGDRPYRNYPEGNPPNRPPRPR